MIHVRVKALIGLHQIVRGQLPELLCHPLLFLTLASFCSYLLLESFTASWAIGLNIVALGISLVVSGVLFRLALTPAIRAASPDFNKSAWFSSALSLMAVGGMNILNSRMDILMLGSLGSPEDVGVYHIANRGAEFVLLILGPVHTALGPMISSTYARRDFVGLQALVTSTNRVLSLLALPIAAGLLLFAVPFLSLFGKGYTDGRIALSIMATGHFFTLLLGPVALLLSMTQYERVAAKAMASSVVLNLILNAVLIPRYGLNGAAIATMSSKLMATVLMGTVVFATLRINPTVMGSRHSERAMNQSP